MKFIILAALAVLALVACAPINSAYNAALTQGAADYASAKLNIQATDDMKLKAFVDSSCAINIGALQRAVSSNGNPAVANGVFTLCPVPGVGVTTNTPTGTMQVQTFTIPITGITDKAPATGTTPTSNGGSVSTNTPPPVTANTSALKTYVPKPGATKSAQKARPTPTITTPTAIPVPSTPMAPAQPAFGTLAPNPNFQAQPSSLLPSALPGQ